MVSAKVRISNDREMFSFKPEWLYIASIHVMQGLFLEPSLCSYNLLTGFQFSKKFLIKNLSSCTHHCPFSTGKYNARSVRRTVVFFIDFNF